MALKNTIQTYATFMQQLLAGDYLQQPSVIARLEKAQTDTGEMSRLFNDLPHQSTTSTQLYQELFSHDLAHSYQNMHALIQITLKQILAHKDAIIAKLPPEHKGLLTEPAQLNTFIQALITAYSLELNAAYNALPEEQRHAAQDEFMFFKTVIDHDLTQALHAENVLSEQLIQLPQEKLEERTTYLSTLWQMKNINAPKMESLTNALQQTQQDIQRYLGQHQATLSHENITKLESIAKRAGQYADEIHFDNRAFAEIHHDTQALQNDLKNFKNELKENRRQNITAEVSHQWAKFMSPSKTISGITSHLAQALTESRPDFMPAPATQQAMAVMQHFKEELSTIVPAPSSDHTLQQTSAEVEVDEHGHDKSMLSTFK